MYLRHRGGRTVGRSGKRTMRLACATICRMTPDLPQLRRLAQEYDRLHQLVGDMTPQGRGQRLNGLVAEVFQSWGHRAQDDLNATGNIDVAFAIGDQRYILEAKWEKSPINIDPIAKLQRRVSQRLAGTIGVVLSMSGYTADTLDQIHRGQRLEVILLESCHLEAMLTGFSPPSELFEAVLDRAHFHGDPTSSLEQLFHQGPNGKHSDVSGIAANSIPTCENSGGIDAKWIINGLPPGQCAVSTFSDGRLLLTTGAGLFEVSPQSSNYKMYNSISGVTTAQVLQNDEVAVVRRQGIGVLKSGKITIRGGPYGGRITFADDSRRELVAFSNSFNDMYGDDPNDRAAIITLRDRIGQDQVEELDYPAGAASSAIRFADGKTLVLGSQNVLIDPQRGAKRFPDLLINPFGGSIIDESHVLICGGDVEIIRLNIADGTVTRLATFNMHGSVGDIAMSRQSQTIGYLYSHEHNDQKSFGAVVRFSFNPFPEGNLGTS